MTDPKARVLCVENYTESYRLIDQLLFTEKFNLEFTITHSPIQALSLVADEAFDLYIVKSRLPEMTGVEFCRHVRKKDKATPILFLSGRMRPSDCKVALAAGVNEYLVLPVALNKLAETVKRLLDNKPIVNLAQPHARLSTSCHAR